MFSWESVFSSSNDNSLSYAKTGMKAKTFELRVFELEYSSPIKYSKSNTSRDRNAARATLGKGLAVSAFPLYVPG